MKMRRMGRTGLKVSEICLGTMTFGHQCDEKTSFAIMDRAATYGVNFLDTADVYPVPPSIETAGRTEEIVGRWLKGRRQDFVLATKVRHTVGPRPNDAGLSRKHIMEAAEASLRRLQTDYVDLYQAHAPDPETPIDETLRAFDDLVHSGKVLYTGASNFKAWQLATALWTSEKLNLARFDCLQPRYNILYREIEKEILPLCREQGLGVIAFNPLAGGMLTGKHQPGQPPAPGTRFALGGTFGPLYRGRYWHEATLNEAASLAQYFRERGRSPAQAAIAWLLAQPGITSAIVGATGPEQLDETLPGAELALSSEEMERSNQSWFNLPRQPNE
jgi:aryl-alcohol dehydrogenase-like predicted oxidoreductase